MKKIIPILCALLSALILFSCSSEKVVRTMGGYDVTDGLEKLCVTDEKIAEFLAPYALADKVGFDRSSDSFKTKCTAESEIGRAHV